MIDLYAPSWAMTIYLDIIISYKQDYSLLGMMVDNIISFHATTAVINSYLISHAAIMLRNFGGACV